MQLGIFVASIALVMQGFAAQKVHRDESIILREDTYKLPSSLKKTAEDIPGGVFNNPQFETKETIKLQATEPLFEEQPLESDLEDNDESKSAISGFKSPEVYQKIEKLILKGTEQWSDVSRIHNDPLVIRTGDSIRINAKMRPEMMSLLFKLVDRTYRVAKREQTLNGEIQYINQPSLEKSLYGEESDKENFGNGSIIVYNNETDDSLQLIAFKHVVFGDHGTAYVENVPSGFVALVKDLKEQCFYILVLLRGSQAEEFFCGEWNHQAGSLLDPFKGSLPMTQRWMLWFNHKGLFGPSWQSNLFARKYPATKEHFGFNGYVHAGYAIRFESFKHEIESAITELLYKIPVRLWPYVKVVCSGHSQGGAMAALFYAHIAERFQSILPGQNRFWYVGLSSARVFNGQETVKAVYRLVGNGDAEKGKDNTLNIASVFDLVPNVPFGEMVDSNGLQRMLSWCMGADTGYVSFGHYAHIDMQVLCENSFKLGMDNAQRRKDALESKMKLLEQQLAQSTGNAHRKEAIQKEYNRVQQLFNQAVLMEGEYQRLLDKTPRLVELFNELYEQNLKTKEAFKQWKQQAAKSNQIPLFGWMFEKSKSLYNTLYSNLGPEGRKEYSTISEILGILGNGSRINGIVRWIALHHLGTGGYFGQWDDFGDYFHYKLLDGIFEAQTIDQGLQKGHRHASYEVIPEAMDLKGGQLPKQEATPETVKLKDSQLH